MKQSVSYSLRLACLFLLLQSCHQPEKPVRLNDIQVIGSHNSYKIPIEKPLWDYIYSVDSTRALELQYGHIPLEKQLDLGLRNLELDVLYDPQGGRYVNPKGLDIVRAEGEQPLPYDVEGKLREPGLKMFHIQDIDFRSHYLLFTDALRALKKWSRQHPEHTPIFITMNTKDSQQQGTRKPLPFTKQALDSIDIEIRNVFSDDELITPDLVRGDCETLEQAILTKGWPELKNVRGRFLFVLDEKRDKIDRYLQGHPSLRGRVLFVNAKEGHPEAAFRIINNPIKNLEYIQQLVKKGYMVRTRADANTWEARANYYTRFHKAIESGAQVITTDYYIPTTPFHSTYQVRFENNMYERIKTNFH